MSDYMNPKNDDGATNSPRRDKNRNLGSSRRFLGGATASALTLCIVGGGILAMRGDGDEQRPTPPEIAVPTASPTPTSALPKVSRGKVRRTLDMGKSTPTATRSSAPAVAILPPRTALETPSSGPLSAPTEKERVQRSATAIASLPSTTAATAPTTASPTPSASVEGKKGKVATQKAPSPASIPRAAARAFSVSLAPSLSDNPVAPPGTEDGISHSVDGSGRWVITGTYQGKDIAQTVALSMKYSNGKIPSNLLCTYREATLRCDAAAQLSLLDKAYVGKFGSHLTFGQGYRSLSEQYSIKASWTARGAGYMAATPGTSNHGLGQAMDFSGPASKSGTAQNAWLVSNSPSYGWIWPLAMRPGGSGPHESWHFDFMGPGIGGSTAWDLSKGSGTGTSTSPKTNPTTSTPRKGASTASPKPTATPSKRATSTASAPSSPSPSVSSTPAPTASSTATSSSSPSSTS